MKEALLILHGALGAKSQFEELANLLSDDFEIHLLNFEGHGGGASQREFSIDHFSENLLEFIEDNSLAPIRVFGYSMGGYVALNTAIQRPEIIKSIVTLGTKFAWTPESAKHEVQFLNSDTILEKVPKYAQMLENRHSLQWKEVLKKTAAMMLDLGNRKALKNEDFEKVRIPVKIMLGDNDQMVSREESNQVSKYIPNSTFAILQNSAHPIEKVDLNLLKAEIKNF